MQICQPMSGATFYMNKYYKQFKVFIDTSRQVEKFLLKTQLPTKAQFDRCRCTHISLQILPKVLF